MIKFTIKGRLPGLNDYIAYERTHRLKGAKMKKEAEDAVIAALSIRDLLGHCLKPPVSIDYLFVEKDRRRDKDNVAGFAHKVIQDGIVRAGLLPNDGWNEIDHFSDAFAIDKDRPRIEITIYEKGDEKT